MSDRRFSFRVSSRRFLSPQISKIRKEAEETGKLKAADDLNIYHVYGYLSNNFEKGTGNLTAIAAEFRTGIA